MAESNLTTNVRIAKFCEATGYTQKAIRRKIEDGVWLEGFEYHRARREGTERAEITVFVPGAERWAKGLPRVPADELAKAT